MVRTRFAPSPTGYLHIGGARTALFSWAYARKHGGKFVLRIEDTDLERHTEEAVTAIYESMRWLGLDWDEGPFRQMQRLARYREVADELIRKGRAYACYASKEELDAMRETQRAHGEKPRYDGRWRPENAKGKTPPAGVTPVIRFRNPDDGDVAWTDLVKGPISISNRELDDLVILRADGVPTYNFGVVVDDLDMAMTHVIRGDDHVNNTPRQINIYDALGAPVPQFGHVPMILGPDGEKLSKRHGAVSVTQYDEDGYLPEALVNYLARLGWSHGDDEVFPVAEFIDWFELDHISRSPAQFNPEKLAWLNHQYMKTADPARLAQLVAPRIEREGGLLSSGPPLGRVTALLRDRAQTLNELADAAMMFYRDIEPSAELTSAHLGDEARAILGDLRARLERLSAWEATHIVGAIGETLKARALKMPKVAMPLRVAVFGQPQTPDIGTVLELAGRERVLRRLAKFAC
ncbi:MAG: glutamate--tRNA ligase [Burkholderiales bacterium]